MRRVVTIAAMTSAEMVLAWWFIRFLRFIRDPMT
jgi:hypothetical protein